jgi:hypothetical protein
VSLKAFHVLFVSLAFLFVAGFAVWSGLAYTRGGATADLVLGVVSAVVALALPVYGRWFLSKTRDVSYL